MEPKTKTDSAWINQRVFEIISTLIVCLMMMCVGVSITQLGQRMISGLELAVLPVLTFLVSLERMVTYKRFKRLVVLSKSWILYQLSQWVVILIVLKLALYIVSPPESWAMEFQLWRISFFDTFFDTPYTYSILYIVIIWMLTGYFADLLDEMSLEESLIRYETAIAAPVEGPPARERLLGMVFGLGFILVMITALLRVNLRFVLSGGESGVELLQPLPYLAAGAWNVLLYFLLGLGLMSLSQFARLNARWSFQKIEVTPKLAGKWAAYSIGFIFILAVAISLLPTNYSLGLLSSLAQVLTVLYGVIIYIVGFFFSILIFLIGLLMEFLGLKNLEEGAQTPPEFIPPEVPETVMPDGVNPWWDLIKSLIFWLVLLGLVGYSLYSFARQHEDFWESLRGVRIISWLGNAWQAFKRLLKGVNQQISAVIDSGLERLRSRQQAVTMDGVRQLFQYRRLDNRQRVFLTFFTMLRRSGQKGIRREESQTPYEFAQRLESVIPETEEDVDGVTEAFMSARYSRKEVNEERVSLARRSWSKIRKALNLLKN